MITSMDTDTKDLDVNHSQVIMIMPTQLITER